MIIHYFKQSFNPRVKITRGALNSISTIHGVDNKISLYKKKIRTEEPETFKLFLEKNLDIIKMTDKNNKDSLMIALESDRTDNFKALIKAGAAIDRKDNEGRTILFSAVSTYNIEALKILIEKSANPLIKDLYNYTPVQWCIQIGNQFGDNKKILEMLIRYTKKWQAMSKNIPHF